MSVPDSNGEITAVFKTADDTSPQGAVLNVLDSSIEGETPPNGWSKVTWSQTGPQGPAGAQGPVGAQGSTGPAGPQGAAGPQGPQGPAGASASLAVATVAPDNDGLPNGGASFTDGEGNVVYLANGAQGVAGPAGPQGLVGPQGPQGIQGPAGIGLPAIQLESTATLTAPNTGYGILDLLWQDTTDTSHDIFPYIYTEAYGTVGVLGSPVKLWVGDQYNLAITVANMVTTVNWFMFSRISLNSSLNGHSYIGLRVYPVSDGTSPVTPIEYFRLGVFPSNNSVEFGVITDSAFTGVVEVMGALMMQTS